MLVSGFIKRFYCFHTPEEGGSEGGGSDSGSGDSGAGTGSITLDIGAGGNEGEPELTPEVKAFRDTIPEAYRDKPYLKDVDSADKLFQQFDNAQSLIGKKTIGIPDDKATPEDWEKYYESVRPKEAKEYGFEKLELKEEDKELEPFVNSISNEKLDEGIKAVFHKHGLAKAQAEGVYKDVMSLMVGANKEMFQQIKGHEETLNQDFTKQATKKWGDKAEAVCSNVEKMIKEHTPAEMAAKVTSLDNGTLIAVGSILDGIYKKYGVEDNPLTGGSGGEALSESAIRAEGTKLIAERERIKDPNDPRALELTKRINANYERLRKKQ